MATVTLKAADGLLYQINAARISGASRQNLPTAQSVHKLLKNATLVKPARWPEAHRLLMSGRPGAPKLTDEQALAALCKALCSRTLFLTKRDRHSAKERASGRSGSKSEGGPIPEVVGPSRQEVTVDAPISEERPAAISHAEPGKAGGSGEGAASIACTEARGCPISMVSGEELLSLVDGELPGPLPFVWQRVYRSSQSHDIGLGHGWTHSGCERLYEDGRFVELSDDEGRTLRFKRPRVNQSSLLVNEQMELEALSSEAYALREQGQPHKIFTRLGQAGHFRLTQVQHPAYKRALSTLTSDAIEHGFVLSFHYDECNALVRIAGNWGKTLQLVRDSRGRIARVSLRDEASKQSRILAEYAYDGAGDLIAQRDGAGRGEDYHFENHVLVRRTLATGFSSYYEWDRLDSQARCLRTWGDKGVYDYRFTWDPANRTSTATDSRNYTTRFVYNEFGLITEETDNEGHVHCYTYDNGLRSSYTDPEGNVTRYTYDEASRPIGEIDPLNQRQTRYYFRGKLVSSTGKDGAVWKRSYNARGLIENVTAPDGQTTEYSYNAQGLLTQQLGSRQRKTRYVWNKAGELTTLIGPEGHKQAFQYNAWGQVVQMDVWLASRQHGGTTRYHYNASGALEKVQYPTGETVDLRYNANGQVERMSDRRGRVTHYEYDGLSQVIRKTDPEGNRLAYEYDTERNLVRLTNENGDDYQFVYDGNERLIEEIGFDGRRQTYRYNRAGHLIKHVDAGTAETLFERNPLGQMLAKTGRSMSGLGIEGSMPAGPEEVSRYLYDPAGRLKETYNNSQYLAFAYDRMGRVVKEHRSDLNDKRQRISDSMVDVRYKRDVSGQLSTLQLPDGQIIDYRYDASDRLKQVGLNGDLITSIERNELGMELNRQQGELITQSDYDPMGRLVKQQALHRERQTQVINREYQYNTFGNLSHFKDGNWEVRYVYDMVDRLKRTEGDLAEQFVFDPAGNLLGHQKSSAGKTERGNRLTVQGDRKFQYDARGNLTREARGKGGKLVTAFEYNLNNQLVSATKDGQTTHYKYDPLGRRIEKRDAFGTTQYLWAGDQLLQEQRNNINRTYVYEPESFKPIAIVQDGEVYHYHLDHLGTPRELTDQQGSVVWKAQYKTYGNVAVKEVEQVENNLRFQGQYFDEETGLHYNRHRYYDPNTGQFTTQDPVGLLGGVNSYQYAPNPVGWVDPLGLTCSEPKYSNLKQMESEYLAEELGFAKAWAGFGNPEITYFDSEAERMQHEVLSENGRLLDSQRVPLDSGCTATGKLMFVMDPQGRIFATEQKVMELHHSSFLAGAPVAAAGEMMIVDGQLVSHSRRSGHYKPTASHHEQFRSEMAERGIDLGSVHEDHFE